MRVALIAPHIPDYCIEYSRVVAETCDVLLCIADKYSTHARPNFNSRLEIDWLSWPRQREVVSSFPFIRRLSRRILQWRPDVVHFLCESNLWLNLLALMLKSVPIVTTVHDVELHPGDYSSSRVPRFLIKNLVWQSDAIIVHGDKLRAEASRKLPVKSDKVFVVPHPPLKYYLELAKQGSFRKPDDGIFRILFFGRIYEYKGLRYLLEAAPLVHRKVPRVQFVIAGTGDDVLANYPGLNDIPFIRFDNQFIPTYDAARLFAEADLLVLPYIEASQSGVLMIALPFGLPVVATEVGEIAALVRSCGTGLVVPPRNVAALVAAITKIALDNELRNLFSNNAKQAVAGEYSEKKISATAFRIYQKITNKHCQGLEMPTTCG